MITPSLIYQLGFYVLSYIFVVLEWRQLVSGLCVASAGFIFGGLFAWMARLDRAQIIAVAMETGLQNSNIAYILLQVSLPSPYSDIAALPSIAQVLMCTAILYVMYITLKIHTFCTKKQSKYNVQPEEHVHPALMNNQEYHTEPMTASAESKFQFSANLS